MCNLGKCAFYYSFDNSTKADNPKVCQSGYISKNNTCSPGLRSRHPGNPCTYDLDCEYVDENDKVVKTGKCTCGFNSGKQTIRWNPEVISQAPSATARSKLGTRSSQT